MNVLQLHNQYKQPGGEDAVVRAERLLLENHGHKVSQMIYKNTSILNLPGKVLSGLKAIYNPGSARELKCRINSFRPDVIHIHNFLPLLSPSVFFIARKMKVPVILTLHNYRMICPSATLFYNGHIYEESIHSILPLDAIWKGVYRDSSFQTAAVALMTYIHRILGTWRNKIDGYIALTEFARSKFRNSNRIIPGEKLFVKPNFVEDIGVADQVREDFYLFVGRLTNEKGLKTLMEAAALFEFRLTIIGDGPLRTAVEDIASCNSNITFLGFQSKEVVIEHLKKCRALIFPSIWYEGFPMTLLEAFSGGCPVIASNLGSMKEIIQDRMNGLLFESGNAQDLGEKIREINNNLTLSFHLAKGARETYLKNYTPEINYEQLIVLYEKVIEERVGASGKYRAELISPPTPTCMGRKPAN